MSEHDELREQIGGFIEAYTGYHKDEGKTGWSMDVHHTAKVVADVDGMIDQIIALVRADERKRIREALLGEASRYSDPFHIDVSTLCEIIGLTEEAGS